MAVEKNQLSFWTAVGATSTQVWWTTFRIQLPWVVLALGVLTVLGVAKANLSIAAFSGWLAGFSLAWGLGIRLPVAWMPGLTLVASMVGVATGLGLAGADTTRIGLAIVALLLLHACFGGTIRMLVLRGGPVPWLTWPSKGPVPNHWVPRPLPGELRVRIEARVAAAVPRVEPDPAALKRLDLTWPCTSAELEKAFEASRLRLAALKLEGPVRMKALRELGQARQAVEVALDAEPGHVPTVLPDLAWLWQERSSRQDREVVLAAMRYTDPIRAIRLAGLPGAATPLPAAPGPPAPDDRGDPAVHHDYVKIVDGVASTFGLGT